MEAASEGILCDGEADARLIAAAPELLEAAIAAEQALRYLAGTLHADRLAAAIAKATGSAA